MWQSPPHNSPLFVPTSTGSATCTASYSATGKAFSDRYVFYQLVYVLLQTHNTVGIDPKLPVKKAMHTY